MGRIKTKAIKAASEELILSYQFTENFEENKKLIEQYAQIPSKKLRNIVAGYVTRLTKSREAV